MNFYDFNGMSDGSQGGQNGGYKVNCGGQRESQSFEEKFASFAQKSEEELTAQLLESAKRMKAQGSFDSQALENLYNTACPMLNDAQRQRMRSIIDMLKN